MFKDYKIPSNEEIKKRWCEVNLKSPNPRTCKVCGSKYMYFDSMAGPIVGGVGTWKHPPNAHNVGSWVCLDCQIKSSQKAHKRKEEQRKKEAPQQIEEKKQKIKKLQQEIEELEKLI